MKKIIISLVLVVVLVFSFCSCGNETKDLSLKEDDLKTYAKLGLEFTKDAADKLGTYTYYENASCGYTGLDKIYTYDSYEITTYPKDGKDYVLAIELTKETEKTSRNISIGSSFDDLTKAYGDKYTKDGNVYSYVLGDCSIDFTVRNDEVKAIIYSFNASK